MQRILTYTLTFLLFTMLSSSLPTIAHDSWISKYGLRNNAGEWCCGDNDCLLIEKNRLQITNKGYLLDGSELIPFAETQPSQDSDFWRCKRPDGSRRCFFAPPPST